MSLALSRRPATSYSSLGGADSYEGGCCTVAVLVDDPVERDEIATVPVIEERVGGAAGIGL